MDLKKYSNKNFPPYTFVPGKNPHPRSHPDGHSYNLEEEITEPLNPNEYEKSQNYLYGIDLFNYGYYWEAHEAWEAVWKANNKEGMTADFVKALIKVTASAVKVLQKQEKGIKDHSLAARKIFATVNENVTNDVYAGLSIQNLINFCDYIYNNADNLINNAPENNQIIFKQRLNIII